MRVLVLLALLGGLWVAMRSPDQPPAPAVPPAKVASIPVAAASAAPFGAVVLDRAADGHFYADAAIDGIPVRMLVDTGASVVALTEEDATRAGIAFDPLGFRVIGRGAAGEVWGQPVTIASVAVGGRQASAVAGVVMRAGGQSLLGQS